MKENYTELRAFAHRIVDIVFDFYETLESSLVWKPVPTEIKEKFNQLLSIKQSSLDIIFNYVENDILPYIQGNIHPKYFAWVQGGGRLICPIATFLASALNANVGVGNHIARDIENQVIEWCKQMFNFPETSTGLLVSGGSMANELPIFAAINYYKKISPKKKDNFVVYCSKETHKCVHKPLQVINGNIDNLRKIDANSNFQIDCNLLEKQIKKDINAGYEPFLLIATIGTVNTGAIDCLDKLIQIKNRYNLWLHVDGAYGAPALLTDRYKYYLSLFDNVDSLAFDFHKLFNINYAVGGFLIKNGRILNATFEVEAQSYMKRSSLLSKDETLTQHKGLELTRNDNALSIWMAFKYLGLEVLIEDINKMMALALYLESKIKKHCSTTLKVVAPVSLTIVCFKFIKRGYSSIQLSELNRRIVAEITDTGKAVLSGETINNEYAIRICIANHRTENNHIDEVLDDIIETGNRLIKDNTIN